VKYSENLGSPGEFSQKIEKRGATGCQKRRFGP